MSLTSTEQLALQNKLMNKQQWEKELYDIQGQKAKLEKTRDLIKEQFRLQQLNDAIAIDPTYFKLLKPTWEFEMNPEYMERHRQITLIGHEIKQLEFGAALAKHQENVDVVIKQESDLKIQLEKLYKEIELLEKKGE